MYSMKELCFKINSIKVLQRYNVTKVLFVTNNKGLCVTLV